MFIYNFVLWYPLINNQFSKPSPRIIFEDKYGFLSDISNFANFKDNISKDLLNDLKKIDKEYRWGTEMVDFNSNKESTQVFYTTEIPGDTEFPEKIPTEWFIKLLEDWVAFLDFIENENCNSETKI